MGIATTSKLNQLLSESLPGGLLFAGWLRNEGYSSQLLKKYRDSGWLEGLARGVMYRRNDNLSALTAIYCYNHQPAAMPVSPHIQHLNFWGSVITFRWVSPDSRLHLNQAASETGSKAISLI